MTVPLSLEWKIPNHSKAYGYHIANRSITQPKRHQMVHSLSLLGSFYAEMPRFGQYSVGRNLEDTPLRNAILKDH